MDVAALESVVNQRQRLEKAALLPIAQGIAPTYLGEETSHVVRLVLVPS